MNFTIKQLSFAFVVVSISFLWCFTQYQKLKYENSLLDEKIIKLEDKFDSLQSEIFTLEIKLFRHERAYEIFEEKNPEASSQLGDIISDETE